MSSFERGILKKTSNGLMSARFADDPTLQTVSNGQRLLRKGDKGLAVKKIQQALIDLGFQLPKYGADGDYGNETISAVIGYQVANGLSGDGIIGPITMKNLDAKFAAPGPASIDPKTQAETDKSTSLMWIAAAMTALQGYEFSLTSGLGDPLGIHQITKTALNTHFHLNKGPSGELVYISTIKLNYSNVTNILNNSNAYFRTRSAAEAAADGGVDKNGIPYPAYVHQKMINFTSKFLDYGPLCRAAMVLHEAVHVVDPKATRDNDFYEHGSEYNNLTPEQAIHNPSSYAAFAQHIFYRKDERYGAGRPKE